MRLWWIFSSDCTPLLTERLSRQRLGARKFASPAAAVAFLGAVQAQDLHAAFWSVGQRVRNATEVTVATAYDAGEILRTHVMRPTWHFVCPADLRELLALTAPRVQQGNGTMYRKLGLDAAAFSRADETLGRELASTTLTRAELGERLGAEGQRLAYLLMHAELEAVICSGPRRGKQLTYALFDERAPAIRPVDIDEARRRWARRYFESHGPARAEDFAWWAGFTVAQARCAVADAGLGPGPVYAVGAAPRTRLPRVHLLSIYDEYVIAYRDRSALGDARVADRLLAMGNALTGVILLDGRIAGTWRAPIGAGQVDVTGFEPLPDLGPAVSAVLAFR